MYYERMQRKMQERQAQRSARPSRHQSAQVYEWSRKAVRTRSAIPLAKLVDATHQQFHDKDSEDLHYNQSFAVIYFFMKATKGKGPTKYIQTLAETGDIELANEELFGKGALEDEAHREDVPQIPSQREDPAEVAGTPVTLDPRSSYRLESSPSATARPAARARFSSSVSSGIAAPTSWRHVRNRRTSRAARNGPLRAQVVPLAQVALEVEELVRFVVEPLDELVATGSYGPAETIRTVPGVVRVVKEQRVAVHGPRTAKQWGEIDAVDGRGCLRDLATLIVAGGFAGLRALRDDGHSPPRAGSSERGPC